MLFVEDRGLAVEEDGEVSGEDEYAERCRWPGVSRGIIERMGIVMFIAADIARVSLASVALLFATFW